MDLAISKTKLDGHFGSYVRGKHCILRHNKMICFPQNVLFSLLHSLRVFKNVTRTRRPKLNYCLFLYLLSIVSILVLSRTNIRSAVPVVQEQAGILNTNIYKSSQTKPSQTKPSQIKPNQKQCSCTCIAVPDFIPQNCVKQTLFEVNFTHVLHNIQIIDLSPLLPSVHDPLDGLSNTNVVTN